MKNTYPLIWGGPLYKNFESLNAKIFISNEITILNLTKENEKDLKDCTRCKPPVYHMLPKHWHKHSSKPGRRQRRSLVSDAWLRENVSFKSKRKATFCTLRCHCPFLRGTSHRFTRLLGALGGTGYRKALGAKCSYRYCAVCSER
uniref:Uncharacterized protein n=1 Tax=Molossus molossus TaxID=27622 RepID=A0A7J8JWH9_MOLMO|nr:hypothetical protein HJG59_007870 [Molossus molossus]